MKNIQLSNKNNIYSSELEYLYAIYQTHQRGGALQLTREDMKKIAALHKKAKQQNAMHSKYPIDIDIPKSPSIGKFYLYVKKYINHY